MNYLKLIRINNLLFLIFLIWTFRYFVLVPLLLTSGIDVSDNYFPFVLLTLATVFIAAGGYVINNYYDVRIDKINRPEKIIVTKFITKPKTLLLHQILTASGLVFGLALSHIYKSYALTAIFILTPALLWYYSANLKRKLFIGNVLISLLAGLSVLIISITEIDVLKKLPEIKNLTGDCYSMIYGWTAGFSVFSVLLTFAREIIKDMEDIAGDAAFGCRSVPIVLGIKKTKIILIVIILITISLLIFSGKFLIDLKNYYSTAYIIFFLVIPLVILTLYVNIATQSQQYKFAAGFLKIIMISGVLYTLIFALGFTYENNISLFNILFN